MKNLIPDLSMPTPSSDPLVTPGSPLTQINKEEKPVVILTGPEAVPPPVSPSVTSSAPAKAEEKALPSKPEAQTESTTAPKVPITIVPVLAAENNTGLSPTSVSDGKEVSTHSRVPVSPTKEADKVLTAGPEVANGELKKSEEKTPAVAEKPEEKVKVEKAPDVPVPIVPVTDKDTTGGPIVVPEAEVKKVEEVKEEVKKEEKSEEKVERPSTPTKPAPAAVATNGTPTVAATAPSTPAKPTATNGTAAAAAPAVAASAPSTPAKRSTMPATPQKTPTSHFKRASLSSGFGSLKGRKEASKRGSEDSTGGVDTNSVGSENGTGSPVSTLGRKKKKEGIIAKVKRVFSHHHHHEEGKGEKA
jgi:hypothetical protein